MLYLSSKYLPLLAIPYTRISKHIPGIVARHLKKEIRNGLEGYHARDHWNTVRRSAHGGAAAFVKRWHTNLPSHHRNSLIEGIRIFRDLFTRPQRTRV
jgi:hypothetical protein